MTFGPRNDSRLTAGGTSFLNGSLGITQQTTSGATTSFIRDPNGNLISMRTSTGASFYYTMDGLGSTILLTDSAQAAAATYSYDSWGNATSSGAQAATNPWTYAAGYNDTTSNRIKFGARYYNPFHGRLTQADPSGQEANPYLYAGGNPVTNADPTGLAWCDSYGVCRPAPSALGCFSFNACGSTQAAPPYVQCINHNIINNTTQGALGAGAVGALGFVVGPEVGGPATLAGLGVGAFGGIFSGIVAGVQTC